MLCSGWSTSNLARAQQLITIAPTKTNQSKISMISSHKAQAISKVSVSRISVFMRSVLGLVIRRVVDSCMIKSWSKLHWKLRNSWWHKSKSKQGSCPNQPLRDNLWSLNSDRKNASKTVPINLDLNRHRATASFKILNAPCNEMIKMYCRPKK